MAKNLVLAGPREVALWDDVLVGEGDLGSSFYLGDADVGVRGRAPAVVEQLQ